MWACAVGLLVSAPGQSNVRFGQVSVFIVLLALADALEAVPMRYRGVLVGVAAAIKLTPALFIVFYLLTGRRREAARAAVTFSGCTAVAALVLPGASREYWKSALFSTSRIGDLAAVGNQSVNGLLLRAGIPGAWRPAVWLVVLLVLCTLALWRARDLARDRLPAHAAVLVGCATLAASPVSWTHHQFWTVLAAMLLVAGPSGARQAAGWLLLASMTVSFADVVARLPVGGHALFVAENFRGLSIATLCVLGFGHLTSTVRRETVPMPPSPMMKRRWTTWRPPRTVLVAWLGAAGLYAAMPLPGGADPDLRVSPPAEAIHIHQTLGAVTADLVPCIGLVGPAQTCEGPSLPIEMPVNYSVLYGAGSAEVEGFAGSSVTRLDYLPAPGTEPTHIPLGRLSTGDQVFAFTAGDTTYAQLKAYDSQGHFIGDAGGKLRE